MTDPGWAELLLGGPRGRRLCMAVTGVELWDYLGSWHPDYPPDDDESGEVVWLSPQPYGQAGAEAMTGAMTRAWVAGGGETPGEWSLLSALDEAVSEATYWQPPDQEDLALKQSGALALLQPVAVAVAESSTAARWKRPLDLNDQHFVSWLEEGAERGRPPALTGAAGRLARWRADTSRMRGGGGSLWWSNPALYDIVTTSPGLSGLPASQLVFVEDPIGLSRARVARLQPKSECRVYEILCPDDWVNLVERYPLDVSGSRGDCWRDVTGCAGPWLIPDWPAVAADYDAVHLAVIGYLTTAGLALPASDAWTLLAGWEPDVTYWLGDVLEQVSQPITWNRNPDDSNEATFGWGAN